MVNKSLGLLEVVGLAAALAAADAAVKAANVQLMGYELTKGGGLVLVKLCGDVGAVTAGVQAGSIAASKVSKVLSTHVIPRPHQQLACMLASKEILAAKKQSKPIEVIDKQVIEHEMIKEVGSQPELTNETEEVKDEMVEIQVEGDEDNPEEQVIETSSSELDQDNSEGDSRIVGNQQEKKQADICNLCNDPACHRKKGDPKITCIYYGKNNLK